MKELLSRAKLVLTETEAAHAEIPGLSRQTWKAARNVLANAMVTGVAFDLAEKGLIYFALRARDGRSPASVQNDLVGKLQDLGFDRKCQSVTTEQLQENDAWSALVRPIPLWPIQASLRAALMAGELVFGCVVHPDIWQDSFQEVGLSLNWHSQGWTFTRTGVTGHFDQLEVEKLALGLAFAGVSARDIAARLANSLSEGQC